MGKPPNKLGAATFLGIAGLLVSLLSFLATLQGNITHPYFITMLVALGIIGAFFLGYNVKSAIEYLGELVDRKIENAAEDAAKKLMPEIREMSGEETQAILDEES